MTQSTSDERRPFLSAPCPQRYFAAGAIEEARQRIVRAIARYEGPAMLIGGAGTGKSLLLAVLAEQFAPRLSVVVLEGAQLCTRRALLQTILCELGLPYRGMDEGELRLALTHYLRGIETLPANGADGPGRGVKLPASGKPRAAAPRRVVLLVDEADALPLRLLEELRVLTNVSAAGVPLVSLVLAGGPILEERFADPQLDGFAQRIAARCYLAPLGREETLQYVRSQVAAAGQRPERLFTAEALEAIYAAAGGLPRLINQLGDQLAWMAEETGCTPVDAALVQQAWSDLQQLPAPWNTEGSAAAGASSRDGAGVIEFGELDAAEGFAADALEGATVDDVLLDGLQIASAEDELDALESEAVGGLDSDADIDDELPASIPIGAGRMARLPFDERSPDETLDATEKLLYSYDELTPVAEDRGARAAASPAVAEDPAEEKAAPAAENPFDEPFHEEEIVVDPYREFEADLLSTAPQVINRLDRAFAAELHRCVQRAVGSPNTSPGHAPCQPHGGIKAAATTPARLLIAEEADEPATEEPAPDGAELAAEPLPQSAAKPITLDLDDAVGLQRTAAVPVGTAKPVGDLLVIEEDDDSRPARLVEGQQFRRLFSALELYGA